MAEHRASRRYARALLSVSEDVRQTDMVSRDLAHVHSLLENVPEFRVFVMSPVVTKQKKAAIFTELLSRHVSDVTMKFILLLNAKDREGGIQEIIAQFFRLRDELMGIARVKAKSVVPFTDSQSKDLVRQLERMTKKTVKVDYALDPWLMGGFIVQHGDTVWDASVKHQLELLRERFMRETTVDNE